MPEAPLLITVALPYECRPIVRLLANPTQETCSTGHLRWHGRWGGTEVVIQETGMGLTAAGASTRAALEETRPSALIASGLAGGLSTAVAIGDAIVPDHVSREGGQPIAVDSTLRAIAAHHLPERRSRRGLLVSVDRVVRTRDDKSRLAAATRADAVDMESAAIVVEADRAGVPVIVIRGASDIASDDLPDLSNLDLTTRRDRLRLAGRALRSPGTARSLARLGWGGHRAMKTVAEVFENFIPRLKTGG